jgi:hypothetical protein
MSQNNISPLAFQSGNDFKRHRSQKGPLRHRPGRSRAVAQSTPAASATLISRLVNDGGV